VVEKVVKKLEDHEDHLKETVIKHDSKGVGGGLKINTMWPFATPTHSDPSKGFEDKKV